MKTYNWIFSCYGQSTAGRIAYWQKMGVAQGIHNMILDILRDKKLDLDDFKTYWEFNGRVFEETYIRVTLPAPVIFGDCNNHEYPWFTYDGKRGIIDMLHYNSELQFHFVAYDFDTNEFKSDGWHTVREGLSLEDTITLFEFVEDRKKDISVLPVDEDKKYTD